MEFTVEQEGGRRIVRLEGALDVAEAIHLRELLGQQLDGPAARVLLDHPHRLDDGLDGDRVLPPLQGEDGHQRLGGIRAAGLVLLTLCHTAHLSDVGPSGVVTPRGLWPWLPPDYSEACRRGLAIDCIGGRSLTGTPTTP